MLIRRVLVTSTLAYLAAAIPTSSPQQDCSTGSIQCCNSLESANSTSISNLLGLLGIVVQDVDALVGLTCSPIEIIGVAGSSCSSQTVCCEDNSIGSLISIGCIPITL